MRRNRSKGPRYRVGRAIVELRAEQDGTYTGNITVKGADAGCQDRDFSWKFEDLRPPAGRVAGDTRTEEELLASAAVSFATYYSSCNRGSDVPDWAPDAETADAIEAATVCAMLEDGEYEVEEMLEEDQG